MKNPVNFAVIPAKVGIRSNKESLPATRYLTGCRVKPGMTGKERQYPAVIPAKAGISKRPVNPAVIPATVGISKRPVNPAVIPAKAGIQSVYLSRSDTLL